MKELRGLGKEEREANYRRQMPAGTQLTPRQVRRIKKKENRRKGKAGS